MHGFEIVEHTMFDRDMKYSLVARSMTSVEVSLIVFKYLRKNKKIFKFKAIRKLGKKIRKMIKVIRKSAFHVDSVQTA